MDDQQFMQNYRTPEDLERAIAGLAKIEPRFAKVHALHGTPSLRASDAGLEGLLMIVTEQFLSLGAAAAIWKRLYAAIQPFTAEEILRRDGERLLSLGLSRAKAKTFHAAAQATVNGDLDFTAAPSLSDELIHKTLTALPGIGPWTADIFLLSCLGRCDAWPSGDLALQASAAHLFELPDRPSAAQMIKLADAWRPHRAAAARLLWAHYRSLKGLKQA